MKSIKEQVLTGERALFMSQDVEIMSCVFEDGESPLKESQSITLKDSIFRWKYPLWYCKQIEAERISLLDTARSGIWYTHHIRIANSTIQAPKTFRRSSHIVLKNVNLPNAQETLWSCENIEMKNCQITGDYLGMNSRHIKGDGLSITGNYAFDGAENIEISNSRILSKDAFWNCRHVVVRDSIIIGEYLGWNSEDVTFINCIIESNQGLCYMDNVRLDNCQLVHTDLAFEYSTVDVDVTTRIESVKNPISGRIKALEIGEVIFDDKQRGNECVEIRLEED